MRHLSTLRWLNLAFGALLGLAALAILGGLVGVGVPAVRDGESSGWIFIGSGVIGGVLVGSLAVAHLYCARHVGHARGRIHQTALALSHAMNFPLGTAFAGYSLWVCWVEPSCKLAFDQNEGKVF